MFCFRNQYLCSLKLSANSFELTPGWMAPTLLFKVWLWYVGLSLLVRQGQPYGIDIDLQLDAQSLLCPEAGTSKSYPQRKS